MIWTIKRLRRLSGYGSENYTETKGSQRFYCELTALAPIEPEIFLRFFTEKNCSGKREQLLKKLLNNRRLYDFLDVFPDVFL